MIIALRRIETVLALALAWVLVFVVPLRRTQALLRRLSAPATATCADRSDSACAVARRVVWIADRLPWHSTCLVRAIAGFLLLARRRVGGVSIRIGVRRAEGRIDAHAWLLRGAEILLGGGETDTYAPLADLGG